VVFRGCNVLLDQQENQGGRLDAEEMVFQYRLWCAAGSEQAMSVLVSKIEGCQRAESECSLLVKMVDREDTLKYKSTEDLLM
jgi:hypothetical protein